MQRDEQMKASKLSASEKAYRKREAARIRQQKCRARKKKQRQDKTKPGAPTMFPPPLGVIGNSGTAMIKNPSLAGQSSAETRRYYQDEEEVLDPRRDDPPMPPLLLLDRKCCNISDDRAAFCSYEQPPPTTIIKKKEKHSSFAFRELWYKSSFSSPSLLKSESPPPPYSLSAGGGVNHLLSCSSYQIKDEDNQESCCAAALVSPYHTSSCTQHHISTTKRTGHQSRTSSCSLRQHPSSTSPILLIDQSGRGGGDKEERRHLSYDSSYYSSSCSSGLNLFEMKEYSSSMSLLLPSSSTIDVVSPESSCDDGTNKISVSSPATNNIIVPSPGGRNDICNSTTKYMKNKRRSTTEQESSLLLPLLPEMSIISKRPASSTNTRINSSSSYSTCPHSPHEQNKVKDKEEREFLVHSLLSLKNEGRANKQVLSLTGTIGKQQEEEYYSWHEHNQESRHDDRCQGRRGQDYEDEERNHYFLRRGCCPYPPHPNDNMKAVVKMKNIIEHPSSSYHHIQEGEYNHDMMYNNLHFSRRSRQHSSCTTASTTNYHANLLGDMMPYSPIYTIRNSE